MVLLSILKCLCLLCIVILVFAYVLLYVCSLKNMYVEKKSKFKKKCFIRLYHNMMTITQPGYQLKN